MIIAFRSSGGRLSARPDWSATFKNTEQITINQLNKQRIVSVYPTVNRNHYDETGTVSYTMNEDDISDDIFVVPTWR